MLMCISRRRKQIGEMAMQELDILPSQHFVLVCLKHMGRAASQVQLAEMMHVSPASVARTLKALDREGYIQRSGGADGRCNEIIITEKGDQVLLHSCSLFQDLDMRSYAGISEEELNLMEDLLGRMLENLSRIKDESEKEMGK